MQEKGRRDANVWAPTLQHPTRPPEEADVTDAHTERRAALIALALAAPLALLIVLVAWEFEPLMEFDTDVVELLVRRRGRHRRGSTSSTSSPRSPGHGT